MQNDLEARNIDSIFANKQEKEAEIQRLEEEIDQERRATETMVSNMDPSTAETYQLLQEENLRIEKVS